MYFETHWIANKKSNMCCEKIDKIIAEYKTRRKKQTNKQKKKHPLQKKPPIKHKDKKPNKKQNQSGIVFSVFRDICVNILQKHRHILQYQITPCI